MKEIIYLHEGSLIRSTDVLLQPLFQCSADNEGVMAHPFAVDGSESLRNFLNIVGGKPSLYNAFQMTQSSKRICK